MKPKNLSAFPFPEGSWEDGMTLRDYFANAAMQGIIIKHGKPQDYHWQNGTKDTHDDLAVKCYKIADAMLKQREI